ncbi:hypothetical protein DRW07_10140 [Alteromonas sediminis]|uniref:GlyGly-CTERM sorting domain-containing protein n=1 Tax=Alteromonas sediminis TaxID=2259342 RepID=A0A3N5YBM9_9ALTE|nr:S8 family serine peptidase [Alteromonas sediminis]RPJ66445.1 hypothetical protein DRW07_10140 [Alteromonas sediminis]
MKTRSRFYVIAIVLALVYTCTMSAVLANTKVLENRYIVELQTPETSSMAAGISQNVAAKRTSIESMQHVFLQSMQSSLPSVAVKRQFSTLINAIEVKAEKDDVEKLLARPEVKNIYPVKLRYGHLDASHQIINSVEAWTLLGGQSEAGKDIKIAIIDSGIRPENPMFDDSGFTEPDLSDNLWLQQNPDYCRKDGGDPNFCNNKVIIARVFVPTDDAIFPIGPDDMTPLDINRHGTHVAGIAAGNPVSITYEGVDVDISGVAPGARLMVYKALFDNSGIVIGTDAMLLEALEAAVKDGADVINNSWGSIQTGTPEDSVFASVFAEAEAQGVVIVSSAGNNGGFSTGINCPGCIEAGLTVANSFHGRVFGHQISYGNNSLVGSAGETLQVFSDLTGPLTRLSASDFPMNNVCSPLPPLALQNQVVLMEYSNQCFFFDFVSNIEQAGAKALLLYESPLFAGNSMRPFRQFSHTGELPVLGLTQKAANALIALDGNTETQISITGTREALVDAEAVNQLNPGSSTGPNLNPNVLKPDITAPGTDILSAAAPEPDIGFPFNSPALPPGSPPVASGEPAYAMLSGTSMSSPQVAGAAALLKQAFPQWDAVQIKTALTSTSDKVVLSGDGSATPFQQGAGLMNIAAAMNTKMTFAQSSHANGACIGSCSFTNTIKNVTDEPLEISLDVTLDTPEAAVFVANGYLALTEQNGTSPSADIAFTIDTSDVAPGTWVFGDVTVSANGHEQRLPIAVFANDNSDTGILSTSLTELSNGEVEARTRIRNLGFEEAPRLNVTVPDFAAIDASSLNVTLENGESSELRLSDSGELIWQGELNAGQLALNSTLPWGNQTLKDKGVSPVQCAEGCMNFSKNVSFSFEYLGDTYSGLTVSSNGFIVVGETPLTPFDMVPPNAFPSEDNVNNIIAPLWANFDLKDPQDPFDQGNGALYIDTVIRDGSRYLIVEWHGVSQFGFDDAGSAETYTFQVIIKENSDEITFNYINVNTLPYAIIGAENHDATLGVTYYNGQDNSNLPLPIVQDSVSLALSGQPSGSAEINYIISLPEQLVTTATDQFLMEEDTIATFDVLQNDGTPLDVVVSANLQALALPTTAKRLFKRTSPTPDESKLTVVDGPLSGTATVESGKVRYQPNSQFFGTDSFWYQVSSADDVLSLPTQVFVTVTPVNDAPVILPVETQTVALGDSVTITVNGQDYDGDSLTWGWQQTGGPQVTLSANANTLNVSTANLDESTTLVFSVTASDGQATSSAVTAQVRVESQISGGGSSFWILLLCIVGFIFGVKKGLSE